MTNTFFEFKGPRDIFEKAKRDYLVLQNTVNADTLFNFYVLLYHVMDYLKANVAGEADIKAMFDDPDFQVCNLIANRQASFFA